MSYLMADSGEFKAKLEAKLFTKTLYMNETTLEHSKIVYFKTKICKNIFPITQTTWAHCHFKEL